MGLRNELSGAVEKSFHARDVPLIGILRLRKPIRIRESACFAQDDTTKKILLRMTRLKDFTQDDTTEKISAARRQARG